MAKSQLEKLYKVPEGKLSAAQLSRIHLADTDRERTALKKKFLSGSETKPAAKPKTKPAAKPKTKPAAKPKAKPKAKPSTFPARPSKVSSNRSAAKPKAKPSTFPARPSRVSSNKSAVKPKTKPPVSTSSSGVEDSNSSSSRRGSMKGNDGKWYTFTQYKNMPSSKRRSLGLPFSRSVYTYGK